MRSSLYDELHCQRFCAGSSEQATRVETVFRRLARKRESFQFRVAGPCAKGDVPIDVRLLGPLMWYRETTSEGMIETQSDR